MKIRFFTKLILPVILLAGLLASCKKDDPEVIAGFTYKADANNFLKIDFTSTAQNFTSLTWDFGDGKTSSETNPSHIYDAAGKYTVKLTATGAGGSDVFSQNIEIVDNNAQLTILAGTTSKTWKLLRVPKGGRYPMQVGPFDRTSIWWAMGLNNDEIANRPCSMNDEFTFFRDGSYKLDDKGDFWVEGNWYAKPDNICAASTPANMKDANGNDMSKFGSGTHSFSVTPEKLTLTGVGAWIGLFKLGTEVENKLPQPSTIYNIKKLTEGTTDTLILENNYKFSASDANFGGYWQLVLVHYDNPADEPAIPERKPAPDFTFTTDLLSVTFANSTKYATSYSWDFGDGATSSAENPSHTYAASGTYKVKLTATNGVGSVIKEKDVTVSDGAIISKDNIVGGPWKVRVATNSIFVGPALGDPSWWQVPLDFLNGGKTGTTDDWSCITNDEFIFSSDGKYEYKTNGDARNDGYFGDPNGCWSDAMVAASETGKVFGSAVHSFTVTPSTANSRAKIILTNGSTSKAAFIGFYKGYYGGENNDKTKPANGGKDTNTYEIMSYSKSGNTETLIVSVDISDNKDGSKAWSIVLVR